MNEVMNKLNTYSPEQFIEKLTNEPLVQGEKDVIQSFRNFGLTNAVVNALLHYMFFMDNQADWDKLSKIAQFFSENEINTAKEAMETLHQLEKYEKQLDGE